MAGLGFRADIEGLRAVCVLAVVAYHAGFTQLSGGFVGVDAFFVISGFLITGLLLKELDQTGRIALIAFWARRARRLLPNALLTLFAVLLVGAIFAPPSLLMTVWEDSIAALLYLANYFFAYRTVDYFDETVASSPLLHFWSLSLEEQFYILWPVMLAGIVAVKVKRPRRVALGMLILLSAASFAATLIWIKLNQPAAFFHTESRLWQLGCGGLLAFGFARVSRLPAKFLGALAWCGLVGFASAIFLFDDDLSYPGFWALLPTISTLALLAGGNAGRFAPQLLLGVAPMTWIGRLSYSIYLWHWPVIVMTPMVIGREDAQSQWIALALILPVAWAAYSVVENPIRRGNWITFPARTTLAVAAALSASVAAAALAIPVFLLKDIGNSDIKRLALNAHKDLSREYHGFCRDNYEAHKKGKCTFGDKEADKRVILFGDSHAGHLFDALDAAAHSKHWSFVMYAKPSCPPIEVDVYNPAKKSLDVECIAWREKTIARIIDERPERLFISSWTGWSRKMRRGENGRRLSEDEARTAYIEGSRKVLQRFKDAGLNVTVVRGTPRNRRGGVADCIVNEGPQNCGTARLEAVDDTGAELAAARQVDGVGILDLTHRFCGKNVCQAVIDGMVVYRDATHITATFARTLAPEFAEFLK